jgi:2'-5' RNA ligase
MPRLFTGLEISSQTGLMLSLLRGGLRGARWIDPENYHITLRFIGDVDDPTADEIADALARIRRDSVEIRVNGLGSFGNGKPHAVWARVEPNRALMELQGEQERILQRLRLPAERRKYIPHVTLARCRSATNQDVARWLSEHGGFRRLPSRPRVSCCFPPARAWAAVPIWWRKPTLCRLRAGWAAASMPMPSPGTTSARMWPNT